MAQLRFGANVVPSAARIRKTCFGQADSCNADFVDDQGCFVQGEPELQMMKQKRNDMLFLYA